MADFSKCVENALKSLTEFSADDINRYVRKTLENAKKTGLTGKAAISAVRDDTFNTALGQIGSDAQRSANSVNKYERAARDIKAKKFTVREFVSRGTRNIGNNIESAQRAATNELMGGFTDTLTKDDIVFMQDTSNEHEIGRATDGHTMSPEANRVGRALNNYMNLRSSKMVLSDAMALDEIQSDRWLRAIHDPSRLMNPSGLANRAAQYFKAPYNFITKQSNFNPLARQKWMNFIKSKISLENTFKKTDAFTDGNIDDNKVDTILKEIYTNITEGRKDIFQRTGLLQDVDSIKKRRRMFFHWNDFNSFSEYNREYGAGNLFGALMADIHGSSNRIGMADIFGAAPNQVFETLKRDQLEDGIEKGNTWFHNTNLIYNWVNGTSKVAVSPKMATFFANLRAFGSMARLGGIVFQSLSDANIGASYAQRFGVSYGNAFANQLSTVLTQFTSEEQKRFGEMMHLNMRHHMGYIGRFIEAQNLGNMTSKLTSKYFKFLGMQMWDNGNRLGNMTTLSKQFSKNKNISFGALDQTLRSHLENFNINSTEWNKLRENVEDGHLTVDAVDKLSDADLRSVRKSLGQEDSTLSDVKNQLYRKLHTLYDVAADNAILTPGAYENAMMLRGTRPGTLEGELMRTIMQFKGFAVSFVNRSLAQGWKNAGDGAVKKSLFMAQLFGYMMPLAYMSTYFFNLSKGLSTPTPSNMTIAEKLQWVGAPFGVLSMGLDPNSQNSALLGDMLFGSPTARVVSSLGSSALSLVEGNPKKSLKNATRAAQYLLPGSTFPFVQPYLKKVMGEKEFKTPNQHILFGG